jgi:hypothetical protein
MVTQLNREGTATKTTEQSASGRRGLLQGAWHRVRLTVDEMNYAGRRIVELQAPWIVDDQWHRR